MSCRLSWPGPAMHPGGVTRPVLTLCAGLRSRPSAVAYLRPWPSGPPGHADTMPAWLRAFAQLRGLVLADVYTEESDLSSREGTAFGALVEALRRPHINIVVIPTPEHFSRFSGSYRAMRPALDVDTGTDVLISSSGVRSEPV